MKQKISHLPKFKILGIALSVILLLTAAVPLIYDYIIPDRISYFEGDDIPVYLFTDAEIRQEEREGASDLTVQYKLFHLLPVKTATAEAYERIKVYPAVCPSALSFSPRALRSSAFPTCKAAAKCKIPQNKQGFTSGTLSPILAVENWPMPRI